MQCRACNTRYSDDDRTCPNCGRVSASPGLSGSGATGPAPRRPLGPSSAGEPPEVELEEKVEPRPRKAGAKKAVRERRPPPATESPPDLPVAQLRTLLEGDPALLEPGLRACAEEGSAGFRTDVGPIDLLAEDDAGGLVVVLIAEGDKGSELVAEALQRIGWVRKHVAEPGQEVRGVVLLESRPEDLGYAAAAVAGTVRFKTWRLSLALDDVEL